MDNFGFVGYYSQSCASCTCKKHISTKLGSGRILVFTKKARFRMETQQPSSEDKEWNRAVEKAQLLAVYSEQLQQQLSRILVGGKVRRKQSFCSV